VVLVDRSATMVSCGDAQVTRVGLGECRYEMGDESHSRSVTVTIIRKRVD